jgi:hypothetical protein
MRQSSTASQFEDRLKLCRVHVSHQKCASHRDRFGDFLGAARNILLTARRVGSSKTSACRNL